MCRYLELREGRAWRWRELRGAGVLVDRCPGAALHGITPDEETEILAVFEEFQDVDRSHRKLAHRGSYTERVWVSASTVRRVLAAHELRLRRPPRPGPSQRTPFPAWASYRKHSIWIYDVTQFQRCRNTPEAPLGT